eukprot:CAMPEP_0202715956 /NCGR_PEP_ID=MMETSP1385-20130828/95733_1 /ASSEMBLY_ACC=CAM_ASM_000861 /TAXON_ID=933848 /ORGANISM="Elphidium margaritaceum" /LENGTH=43 /DNA_ID= /DNA_START= /DNA_END= /DNA_ORIENTATION=
MTNHSTPMKSKHSSSSTNELDAHVSSYCIIRAANNKMAAMMMI